MLCQAAPRCWKPNKGAYGRCRSPQVELKVGDAEVGGKKGDRFVGESFSVVIVCFWVGGSRNQGSRNRAHVKTSMRP